MLARVYLKIHAEEVADTRDSVRTGSERGDEIEGWLPTTPGSPAFRFAGASPLIRLISLLSRRLPLFISFPSLVRSIAASFSLRDFYVLPSLFYTSPSFSLNFSRSFRIANSSLFISE